MKGSKLLMTVFVAVLILSLTITTVGAQTGLPQVGEMDEDGDLVLEIAPSAIPGGTGERHDVSGYTLRQSDEITPQGVISTQGEPYSPVNEWVLSKTPKFWFTQTPGATKYKIELRYWWSDGLVYTFKGAGDCNDIPGYCWLKPDTKLKAYEYYNWSYGDYIWRVGAKVGTTWYYSDYYGFGVLSKGFNSTFDLNLKKWYPINGDWFRVDPGYLKTKGSYNSYSSAMQKELFLDDYVVSARMKGKTDVNQYQGIIIGGYPDPIWSSNVWYDGVYFIYSGNYSGVLFIRDGVEVHWTDWYESTAWDPTGWNTMEVTVDAPDAYQKVNGLAEWGVIGFPDDIESGYIGLTHLKYITDKAPFVVDWAKLSYLPTGAMAEVERDMDGVKVINYNEIEFVPLSEFEGIKPPQ